MYKRNKEPIYFIGIGGIGMSGIAEVLARLGYPISGSDIAENETVRRLREIGIQIRIGHKAENLVGAKVVVYSSAIDVNNPEMVEAKKLGLPIVPRAEMLAELMRLRFGIAIAGSHGKTTTTSMLAGILAEAQLDPTIIVGGKVDVLGGNAKLGQGKFIVAEADESDGSFLRLSPVLTIVTNIDNDHLDYYKTMDALRNAFLEFVNKIPYYGRSVLCADDANIKKILPLLQKPHWSYGFSADADFQIKNFAQNGFESSFDIHRNGAKLCTLELQLPGEHNALNAVAAFAAAIDLDIELPTILSALKKFTGVKRRFEKKGEVNGVTVIDDYGHHPTEVAATLRAAKLYWKGRIVVAFQPHRFSRTQVCWNEFGSSLKLSHQTFLLDIYPAGEAPIEGITSQKLAEEFGFQFIGSLPAAVVALSSYLKPGDLLITLGAGSITQLGPMLLGKGHEH